ncbi:MAG: response regulator transcription factor [Brevundimonas sp.]|nr:response regulator transcription factor [Brevundimonas sp.]
MRVLFVEDNEALAAATARSLTAAGFAVDVAHTLEDGWHAWRSTPCEAVVLDIMLEEDSGLDLLARARKQGLNTPVLVLTALSAVDDRVRGLNRGADDYLVKPFAIEELVARLRALARRPEALRGTTLELGQATYDTVAQTLSAHGRTRPLTRAESIVIERFFRAPDRVISKPQLGDALHSLESEYSENSLHILVYRVRRKLIDLKAGVVIHTVRGLGYVASAGEDEGEETGA